MSPNHPIFSIPELADYCLSELRGHQSTLCSVSQTCWALNHRAIPLLWSDLKSVIPLLILLGLSPTEGPEGEWTFLRRPGPQNWDLFTKYSRFIRSLQFGPPLLYKGKKVLVRGEVFSIVAFTRPSLLPLLPELRSIKITTHQSHHQMEAQLWLTHTIEELFLHVVSVDPTDSGIFLQELPRRCPNLKFLYIEYTLRRVPSILERSLAECISGLPALQAVALPQGFVTPPTLDCLGRCSGLRQVLMSKPTGAAISPMPSAASPTPAPIGTFPSLTHFSLYSTITTITTLVRQEEWAPRLESLRGIVKSSDFTEMTPLLGVIATSRPNITNIHLDFKYSLDDGQSLSFSHIIPLLSHPHIRRLSLLHPRRFMMTLDQLRRTLDSWQNLVALSLCADARDEDDEAGMPLDALNIFAEYCPQIEEIGLRFNNTTAIASQTGTLERLKILHIGYSPAPNAFYTSVLLGELCNSRMDILVGSRSLPGVKDAMSGWGEIEDKFRYIAAMKGRLEAKIKTGRTITAIR